MPIRLNKLLCATDLSLASNQVIPYGLALAKAFEAKLFLAHCIELLPPSFGEVIPHASSDRAQESVRNAEAKMRRLMGETAIRWEPLVLTGSPSVALAEAIDVQKVDLVISATRPRPGLRRLLLGSVTESLLHTIQAPVLALRSPEREFLGPEAETIFLRRILVGCDFSPDAAAALEYGLALAHKFGAELSLLHALEPTLYRHMNPATNALAGDIERAVEETVRHKLSALCPGDKYPWCKVKTVFAEGMPHSEILKYASREAVDLIIVGRRGHGLLEEIFLGSTADRVLRQASCPVLVVPAGSS